MSELREKLQQSVMAGNVAQSLTREAMAAKTLLESLTVIAGEDDEFATEIVQTETNFFETLNCAINRLGEINTLALGIDELIGKLKSRSNRLDAQADRIRSAMTRGMEDAGVKKFEGAAATVSLRATPAKAIITAEHELPSSFLVEKTTITPDKKAILDALKKGPVKGAELSNGGTSVMVRFS